MMSNRLPFRSRRARRRWVCQYVSPTSGRKECVSTAAIFLDSSWRNIRTVSVGNDGEDWEDGRGRKRVVAQRTPTSCLDPLFGRWRPDSIPFFNSLFFCFHSFSLLSSLLSRFTPFLSGDQAINSLHLQFLLRTTLSMRNISRLDAVEFSTLSCYKVH